MQAPAGTLYRGREGMWSWVAHRVTGVLIFFFLFAHVLDTALVRVSPDSYNRIMDTYKTPLVNLMEVGLVGAVLFHALNGIRVVLASVLPAFRYRWRPELEPAPIIVALNRWIRDYAVSHGAVYLDFHAAMADERQGLRGELSADGVHPHEAGYRVMAPLAERAIALALRRRAR